MIVPGIALGLGGCAWTQGGQALTVEEYRTLEERWAEERERRLQDLAEVDVAREYVQPCPPN